MLEIKSIPVTAIQQNCRLVIDSVSQHAVLIDPGGEAAKIQKVISASGVTLDAIWLTHSHFDHCGGVAAVRKLYPVPMWAHADEAEKKYRANVEQICTMWQMPLGDMATCPEPEHYVAGGETLSVGGEPFTVLFVPGHSPGHVCFYNAANRILLAGDTLFAGAVGRSDFPGGNHELLISSIRSQLLSLPDATVVMPGHGPDTTVGVERESNPFLNETVP